MSPSRVVFVFSLFSVLSAAQITRHVPANFATIQAAINASSGGDTVVVAPGTYMQSINFGGRAITVVSSGGPDVTTIRATPGMPAVSFVSSEGPSSVLEGFRVINGMPGIVCQASSPTIRNCTITQNSNTSGGGGIRCVAVNPSDFCSPSIVGCRITGNTVSGERGAGLFVLVTAGSSMITVEDCEFSANLQLLMFTGEISGGAGIFVSRVNPSQGFLAPQIRGCRIVDNFSLGVGGGIYAAFANSGVISRCRIEGNSVLGQFVGAIGAGGGLGLQNCNIVLEGCIVAGNSANFAGSGLWIVAGNPVIRSCTITDNATALGSGIALLGDFGPVTLTIVNSIIRGNAVPDIYSHGSPVSLFIDNSVLGVGPVVSSTTNLFVDPRFVNSAEGDYHLATTSPCIDAGSTLIAPVALLDIDETSRNVGTTIDIGADEVPLQLLPGTNEDLDLYFRVDGAGDPLANAVDAPGSSALELRVHSGGGTFVGTPFLVFGQLFAAGSPPLGLVAQPFIHLDAAHAFLVHDSNAFGAAFAPGLDPAGFKLNFLVPFGLNGAAFRAQAFAVTNVAANGLFAVSAARDVIFQ